MTRKHVAWCLAGLLLLGCQAQEAEQDAGAEAMALDGGKRWAVNAEMMPHIDRLEQELEAFSAVPGADHARLAEALQAELKLLIASCTMKGRGHEELHKWLHPYMADVEALSGADALEAEALVAKLRASHRLFRQYFE